MLAQQAPPDKRLSRAPLERLTAHVDEGVFGIAGLNLKLDSVPVRILVAKGKREAVVN